MSHTTRRTLAAFACALATPLAASLVHQPQLLVIALLLSLMLLNQRRR